MKREAELKAAFMMEFKKQLPEFLILRYITNGAPDREIIGNGITTRWEYKHATPDFRSPDDQELMCMRLAVQAHCRYVIWFESRSGTGQRTMIVHPRQVHDKSLLPLESCAGFDHRWLVGEIRKVHQL